MSSYLLSTTQLLWDTNGTLSWGCVAPRFLYFSMSHKNHRKAIQRSKMSKLKDWETKAEEKQERVKGTGGAEVIK